MSAVFLSHPGLQHSHQLALALYEQGLLQAFWSGVPVIDENEKLPIWLPQSYAKKIKKVPIPATLRKHPMLFQVLLRAGAFLPRMFSREDYAHRIFHLYDWWVSRQIKRLKPKVVIAYENSAYHTFRAAKAIGARCILDAPALHHVAAANILQRESTPYLHEINRRKDKEVEMADLILTCSPMAAESYIQAGVPAKKVHSILLGATPPEGLIKWELHNKAIHFMFAGNLRYLKAIDVILEAFSQLHAEDYKYQLSFVGGKGESGWVDAINKTPCASYHGNLSQSVLYEKLAQTDCLLLPSRFDSFGMVVAEAMACGTPAIVSMQTGAKAIIDQFPNSGWVVECTTAALYNCVKDRIENRESLFMAREYALEAARSFTWSAYRERVGQLIKEFVK